MPDPLNSNTLVTLKKICKFLHIKNYSILRKNELISIINKYNAMLKIQKWIRKILSKEKMCPISLEPIKYPCFVFKSHSKVLFYYNLGALREFLIKIGDFRDPSTRTTYSDKQLLEMDTINNYCIERYPNRIKKFEQKQEFKQELKQELKQEQELKQKEFKSVYKASKNKKFYEKIKEKEQELLIFERLLDLVCNEIVVLIDENENINNTMFILNTLYLYDYRFQFRRLKNRSKSHAEYVINKNIGNLNHISKKEKSYNNNQCSICEFVVIFLYQLREEIYI
jgi:hypothetical protein